MCVYVLMFRIYYRFSTVYITVSSNYCGVLVIPPLRVQSPKTQRNSLRYIVQYPHYTMTASRLR